jgi:hypothetical protein
MRKVELSAPAAHARTYDVDADEPRRKIEGGGGGLVGGGRGGWARRVGTGVDRRAATLMFADR